MKLLTATPKWDESRNYWKINVMRDGTRKSFYSSVKGRQGKAECMAKAQKWLDIASDADPIMQDAMQQWIKDKEGHASAATMRTVRCLVKHLLQSDIAKMRLSRISVMQWQRVLDKVGETRSIRTVRNVQYTIAEFCSYCVKCRWLDKVPTGLQARVGKSIKEKVILQPDAIRELFADSKTIRFGKEQDEWWIHMFRFAVLTGMRRGELAGLRWEDIHGTYLNVERSVTPQYEITAGKTENARRKIPLPPTALKILDEQKAMLRAHSIISPWVFPNDQGKLSAHSSAFLAWKRWLRLHGYDERITLHSLRRTMISMHKADLPLELLKQVVGHSANMDTFGVYGKVMQGETEITATIMESTFQSLLAPHSAPQTNVKTR